MTTQHVDTLEIPRHTRADARVVINQKIQPWTFSGPRYVHFNFFSFFFLKSGNESPDFSLSGLFCYKVFQETVIMHTAPS